MKKLHSGTIRIPYATSCWVIAARAICKRSAIYCLILSLIFLAGACTSSRQRCQIRIDSKPTDAFVTMTQKVSDEEKTVPLGRTPLMRYLLVSTEGDSLTVTKRGYNEWKGTVTTESPEIVADMVPLSNEEKGWPVSNPAEFLTVIPVRVGIQKIADDAELEVTGDDALAFKSRVTDTLKKSLQERFGEKVRFAEIPPPANIEFWDEMSETLKDVYPSKVDYYPSPLAIKLRDDFNEIVSRNEGAVLLIRAEGHYMGAAKRFGVPALLTAMSVGFAFMGASTVSLYGPLNADFIAVQAALVHPQTKEVLWIGQRREIAHFSKTEVADQLIEKIVRQIPSRFFTFLKDKENL